MTITTTVRKLTLGDISVFFNYNKTGVRLVARKNANRKILKRRQVHTTFADNLYTELKAQGWN